MQISLTALAQQSQPQSLEQLDIWIEQGEPAPYGGILIPEDHYRELWADRYKLDLTTTEKKSPDAVAEIHIDPTVPAFILGASTATVIIAIISLMRSH